MMTDPASAIKCEVHQLVDLQIQTLRQPSCLTTSDLLDYRVRSKKLTVLYQELDQIRRAIFKGQLSRAS
jgi:predicted solute-binding protein